MTHEETWNCMVIFKPSNWIFAVCDNIEASVAWNIVAGEDTWHGIAIVIFIVLHIYSCFLKHLRTHDIKQSGLVTVKWQNFVSVYGPTTTFNAEKLNGTSLMLFSGVPDNSLVWSCGQRSTQQLNYLWSFTFGFRLFGIDSVRPYSVHCPNLLTETTHSGSLFEKLSSCSKSVHSMNSSTLRLLWNAFVFSVSGRLDSAVLGVSRSKFLWLALDIGLRKNRKVPLN